MSLKLKIYTNHSITRTRTFLKGVIFLGGTIQGGEIFRPMKMLVFAMIIMFLIILGLGVKFSRWGKIHQVGTS